MRRTPFTLAAASIAGLLAACGGSDDAATGCSPATADFTVEAHDDLSFDKDAYNADAGCIEVTYDNTGDLGHTLLIKGTSGFKLTVGDVDTGTVDLAPGTYELFCDIAGHEAGGMKADLVVG